MPIPSKDLSPKGQLEQVLARLKSIVDAAKATHRELTDTEVVEVEKLCGDAADLKAKIARGEKSMSALNRIADMGGDHDPLDGDPSTGYLSLTGASAKKAAAHFAHQIHERYGAKAFISPGDQVFATPLESQSPLELQRIPTSILEVLPTTVRDVPQWRYLRQVAFNNNAAIVAPGAEKPETVITLGDQTGKMEVIAHLTEPIDKYLLEDNATLAAFIEGQMLYGIARRLEAEVLNGNGEEGHFTGLLNTSGIQQQDYSVDRLTTLRLAATKLEVLNYTIGAYVLHPNDWATIETARATSGSFDLGGPIDRAARRVWGTQVITSTGITEGTALALDLNAATVDRDTGGVRSEWDRSQGFKTNQVIARVEGRFGLSVYRPDAIVEIDLTAE